MTRAMKHLLVGGGGGVTHLLVVVDPKAGAIHGRHQLTSVIKRDGVDAHGLKLRRVQMQLLRQRLLMRLQQMLMARPHQHLLLLRHQRHLLGRHVTALLLLVRRRVLTAASISTTQNKSRFEIKTVYCQTDGEMMRNCFVYDQVMVCNVHSMYLTSGFFILVRGKVPFTLNLARRKIYLSL